MSSPFATPKRRANALKKGTATGSSPAVLAKISQYDSILAMPQQKPVSITRATSDIFGGYLTPNKYDEAYDILYIVLARLKTEELTKDMILEAAGQIAVFSYHIPLDSFSIAKIIKLIGLTVSQDLTLLLVLLAAKMYLAGNKISQENVNTFIKIAQKLAEQGDNFIIFRKGRNAPNNLVQNVINIFQGNSHEINFDFYKWLPDEVTANDLEKSSPTSASPRKKVKNSRKKSEGLRDINTIIGQNENGIEVVLPTVMTKFEEPELFTKEELIQLLKNKEKARIMRSGKIKLIRCNQNDRERYFAAKKELFQNWDTAYAAVLQIWNMFMNDDTFDLTKMIAVLSNEYIGFTFAGLHSLAMTQ